MTNLDAYIRMIGETIVDYCNGQLYRSSKPQQKKTILDINSSEGMDKDDLLREIDALHDRLFNLIITSLEKRNAQRQFHLLYFLDKFIFFKKALVNCVSYTQIGWNDFIIDLEKFITNCALLKSNSMVQVSVPIHKMIILKEGTPVTSDDGKYYIVKLKGLNCLTGPSTGRSLSDLGEIVTKNLIKREEPSQVVQELIDNHRVHLQFPKSIEHEKRIKDLEGEFDVFGTEHDKLEGIVASLQEKVDAQAEVIEKMRMMIEALQGKQKTLRIMTGPTLFSKTPLPERKTEPVADNAPEKQSSVDQSALK